MAFFREADPFRYQPIASVLAVGINRAVAPLGIRVSRIADCRDVTEYIPFSDTMAKAEEVGLAVGDYIDARQGIAGATQATIDEMRRLGVFDQPLRSIVEIGPGTGRYLDRTLRLSSPERYEVYETAKDWAAYLAKKYQVILRPTDGASMKATASASVDLVQAHKVLSATPFIVTARYWSEMLRVTRPGAHIVFDVVTAACLPPAIVKAWAATGMSNRSTYPAVMSAEIVTGFFSAHSVRLIGTFRAPLPPGQTEYFVFKRT